MWFISINQCACRFCTLELKTVQLYISGQISKASSPYKGLQKCYILLQQKIIRKTILYSCVELENNLVTKNEPGKNHVFVVKH